MEYIKPTDYEYIMQKYTTGPKGVLNYRFIRRDELFSPETGMDGDAIIEGILENDKEYAAQPHAVRKAQAFAYVLKHTRISCDARDRFPAINAVDRPLNKALVLPWKREVFNEVIPEIGKKRAQLEKEGIVTIWPDYDHSVPIWERVLGLGFAGLLAQSEKARTAKTWNKEQEDFFEGIRITYTAIVSLIERLAELAKKTPGSERMAMALSNIAHNPPANFYEALLVNYLYFMLSEHIEGLQVRSLSNFDRIYYPFYAKDLENGVTEEEIREDLAYFFLQFTAKGAD